jgi:hypothetical protein
MYFDDSLNLEGAGVLFISRPGQSSEVRLKDPLQSVQQWRRVRGLDPRTVQHCFLGNQAAHCLR